jgi:acyl transferase domain-containing protein
MKHRSFVPSLHADEENENIPFQKYGLAISKDCSKWQPNPQGCRLASINSFGFGGTNSHAIVFSRETFSSSRNKEEESIFDVLFPGNNAVVISAATRDSLHKIVHDVRENLASTSSSLEDLSYTSMFCRDHFKFRKLIVTDSVHDFKKQLQIVLEQNEQSFSPVPSRKPQIAFVFCGVGTTWTGMCSEMIDVNPVFRKCVIQIDSHLKTLGVDISIYNAFQNRSETYSNPMLAHIAIFATQLALAASWRHIGIRPSVIVGQSVGEVAAAYESGALSFEDVVTVIYYRSLALSTCQNGAMMVIRNCATEKVSQACAEVEKKYQCKANIAVYNSLVSCTVSGDKEALERLKIALADDAVFIPFKTPCAYHSHYTKDASNVLTGMLQNIKPNAPCIRTFSTVTGVETNPDFASPKYWALNVSQPVLFYQSIKSAKETLGDTIFIELGPRPVLQAHFSAIFPETNDITVPSINKMSEIKTFSNTLNELFEKGIAPTWRKLAVINGGLSKLPRYVFSRKDCTMKQNVKKEFTDENYTGRMVQSTQGPNKNFGIYISKWNTPFVYEHIVDDRIIVPGALYGEVALEIGRNIWNGNVEELEISWNILKPLEIGMTDEKYLPIGIDFLTSEEIAFKVLEKEGSWVLAEGTVKHVDQTQTEVVDIASIDGTLGEQKSNNEIYSFLNALGFRHGPSFRIISGIQSTTTDNLADIVITKTVQMELPRTCFHPVIIDCMFQLCVSPTLIFQLGKPSRILPSGVKKFTVKQAPTKNMKGFSRMMLHQSSKVVCNVLLLRENGTIVAEMQGFEMDVVSGEDHFFEEQWQLSDIPLGDISVKNRSLILSWNEQTLVQAKTVLSKISTQVETVNLSSNLQSNNFLSTMTEQKDVDLYFVPGFFIVESFGDGNNVRNGTEVITPFADNFTKC